MNAPQALAEIIKSLEKNVPVLAAAIPDIESLESFEVLSHKVDVAQARYEDIGGKIDAAKAELVSLENQREELRAKVSDMAADISGRAFAESKPRRTEIEAEMAELERILKIKMADMKAADEVLVSKIDEIAKLNQRIDAVREAAVKSLSGAE